MKRILVSRRAYGDLQRLEDWLAERNPRAAERLGPLLDAALNSLSAFPERGRQISGRALREIPVPFGKAAYLIQYRVDEEVIVVARVLHSREER